MKMKNRKGFVAALSVALVFSEMGIVQPPGIAAVETKVQSQVEASPIDKVQSLEDNDKEEIFENGEKAVTDYSMYEDNELLVIYQDGTTKKEKKRAFDGVETQERESVTGWCDKAVLENGEDLEDAVQTLAQSDDVLYVQPNFKYSVMRSSTGNLEYSALSTSSSAEDVVNIAESEFSKQWWIYNDGTFQEPRQEISDPFDMFWPGIGNPLWPFSNTGYTDKNSSADNTDNIDQKSFAGLDTAEGVQASDWWDSMMGITTVQAKAGIDTNTAKAWQEYTSGGRKTLVAIIDTGVDYTHSDLKDSIWKNSGETAGNNKDDDGNGYIDDVYGWNFYDNSSRIYVGSNRRGSRSVDEDEHGTHVAGIIAAAFNGRGTAGIAANADVELMCLKVLGGSDGSGDTASIVDAITYAEKQGAVICNMSFGINESDIPFYYQDYDAAMKAVIAKSSMLFITAAGNDGADNDRSGVYPSSYHFDNIISVGALSCDGTLGIYSNYGKETVDVAAPGMYIYSTMPGEEYGYMSGTSMAAPMVTAACAMGYAYAKSPDVLAVRERILANVTVLDTLNGKLSTGGMLNVYDAVKDLAENTYNRVNTVDQVIAQEPANNNTGSSESNNGTNGSEDLQDKNIGNSENLQNGNTGNNGNGDSEDNNSTIIQDISGNIINQNVQVGNDSAAAQAAGKKFISGGIIYEILSDTSVAAAGAASITSTKLVIANKVTYNNNSYKVTQILEKAFYKNQSVRTVKIGKNVNTIGKSAFIACPRLRKVTGMEGVTKICASAFKNCKKLKSIPVKSTMKVAKTALSGCTKL